MEELTVRRQSRGGTAQCHDVRPPERLQAARSESARMAAGCTGKLAQAFQSETGRAPP